jgi:hypothetical protein
MFVNISHNFSNKILSTTRSDFFLTKDDFCVELKNLHQSLHEIPSQNILS